MTTKKNTKPVRIDPDFIDDLRKISQIRLNKGLARFKPSELSIAEQTRLLRNTNGYKMSLEELKIKPKKRR